MTQRTSRQSNCHFVLYNFKPPRFRRRLDRFTFELNDSFMRKNLHRRNWIWVVFDFEFQKKFVSELSEISKSYSEGVSILKFSTSIHTRSCRVQVAKEVFSQILNDLNRSVSKVYPTISLTLAHYSRYQHSQYFVTFIQIFFTLLYS